MPYPVVTNYELDTVYRVRYASGTGTTFLLRTPQGLCLATAAHVLAGAQAGEFVQLEQRSGWVRYRLTDITFSAQYDVCTFATDRLRVSGHFPGYPNAEVGLGAELLFLGFPHDLVNQAPGQLFTSPLVRGALFSGVIEAGGVNIPLLDGFNNPGYSGGPIYAHSNGGGAALFGMISGYRPERASHGRIYRRDENGEEVELPDLYTKPNSGMIQAMYMGPIYEAASRLTAFVQERPEGAAAAR